jgi:hypothetical protein
MIWHMSRVHYSFLSSLYMLIDGHQHTICERINCQQQWLSTHSLSLSFTHRADYCLHNLDHDSADTQNKTLSAPVDN